MENQQAPPPPAPVPEKKKGMPAIAWVGIGCGTILLLIVVGISMLVGKCKRAVTELQANPQKTGAEMVVRFNPDLDMVSQDDAAGEMTIRNNKTGEQMTLNYADIAEGRLTVTDAEGGVTQVGTGDIEKVPAWVPRVADAVSTTSVFHKETASGVSGVMSIKSNTPGEELEEFFKQAAEDAGLSSKNSHSMSMNGTETRTLGFKGGSKTLNVSIVGTGSGPLTVQVAYEEK